MNMEVNAKSTQKVSTEPDMFPINKLRENPHKLSQVQKLAQDKSEGEEKFSYKESFRKKN